MLVCPKTYKLCKECGLTCKWNMSLAAHVKTVIEQYPESVAKQWSDGWYIEESKEKLGTGLILGRGENEISAWVNAAEQVSLLKVE